MRKIISFISISFILFVESVSAEQVIRIAVGEWQPYLSENAPHYGFATQIITESFALKDVQVDYGFFPWKRSYQLSRQGKLWDGTAVWLHSEDRAVHFFYSEPVVPTTVSFFHLTSTEFDWSGLPNLGSKKIGTTLGYSYGSNFDSAVKKGMIKTEQSRTDITNLRKLLKGRIDVFPGEVMVMYSLIRESFSPEIAQQFTHHPLPIHQNSQHLLLSKSNPDNAQLIKLFNAGLTEMKESGRYEKIIADGLAGKYVNQ